MLLGLNLQQADEEQLNAVFRCAHSVKGGAATFGFSDVAELTHEMETLLDKLRRRELMPTNPMVDALLASGDALKAMLARHQGDGAAPIDTRELRSTIRALVEGRSAAASVPMAATSTAPAKPATPAAPVAAGVGPSATGLHNPARALELVVGPLDNPALADGLADLFREIADLGTIEPLDGGHAADGCAGSASSRPLPTPT